MIALSSACGSWRRLTGPQNLVSGVEDALSRALADCLPIAPRLDVSPAEFSAGQSDRFTAKKRNGLGFDFCHAAGRLVGVGEVAVLAVQEGVC